MLTIDDHRWINCYSDVHTAGNGLRMRAFLRDVVEPAFRSLDADVAKRRAAESSLPLERVRRLFL